MAEQSAAGSLRIAVVEGEPGIGKTKLLQHVQGPIEALGHEVIWVRHDPLSSQLPFAGVAEVFGELDRGIDATESFLDRNPLQSTSPALQRGVLHFIDAIEKRLSGGSVALFIEDLHFADSSTHVLLASIPRRLLGANLLVVATTRLGATSEQSEPLRTSLEMSGGFTLRLGPLSANEMLEVARDFLGHDPSAALNSSLGTASGNPFLATQLAMAWGDQSEPVQGSRETKTEVGDQDQLPGQVRVAILRRLLPLRNELVHLIEMAAVFGDLFAVADLAAVAGERVTKVWPLLRDLIDRQFLEERGTQLAFRHHLVRSAVYDHIPASLRAALHLDVARYLASSNRSPITVANHYLDAIDVVGAEAVPWLQLAARFQSANDPDAALAYLDKARTLATPFELDELETQRVFAYLFANRMQDAIDAAYRGLERLAASPEKANVRAELRLGATAGLLALGRSREATEAIGGVLDETTDESVKGFASGIASLTSMLSGETGPAEALAIEARGLAVGDYARATATLALNVQARVAGNRLDFATSRRLAEAAIEEASLDPTDRSSGLMPYLFACMAARDDEDMHTYEQWARLGYPDDRPGLAWSGPAYHGMRADMLRLSGQFGDALAEAETGMLVANETQSPLGSALCAATVIDIATRHGDLARATSAQSGSQRWLGPAVASFGFDAFTTASMRLASAKDPEFENTDELWNIWSFAVANETLILGRTLLLPLALALQTRGDLQRLAQLGDDLADWPDRSAYARSVLIRASCLVASGLARRDLATALDGIAVARSGPNRLQLADALVGVSELAHTVGDQTTAAECFRESQSLYEAMGCTLDVTNLRSFGKRFGLRTRPGRPGKRAVSGWESLSPTETKVARLVSLHLTNREIADVLFVSRRTVETHVRNIFGRLSIDSRRELARRFAAERT